MSDRSVLTPTTSYFEYADDNTQTSGSPPPTLIPQDPTCSLGAFHTDHQRKPDPQVAKNTKHVTLPYPRTVPSSVAVGFTGLDLCCSKNFRVTAKAETKTPEGFDLLLNSWEDSSIYRGSASWFETIDPDIQMGTYCTTETREWRNPSLKNSTRVNFKKTFRGPPIVVCWVNHIDEGHHKKLSIKAYPTDIDAYGFTLNIDGWGDTILYGGGAGWMAYPSDKTKIYAGTVDTAHSVHGGAKHMNSGHIDFPDGKFNSQPKVFMAINRLDFDGNYNLRIKAYVDSISEKGMDWHAATWYEDSLHGVGLSFFAIAS